MQGLPPQKSPPLLERRGSDCLFLFSPSPYFSCLALVNFVHSLFIIRNWKVLTALLVVHTLKQHLKNGETAEIQAISKPNETAALVTTPASESPLIMFAVLHHIFLR